MPRTRGGGSRSHQRNEGRAPRIREAVEPHIDDEDAAVLDERHRRALAAPIVIEKGVDESYLSRSNYRAEFERRRWLPLTQQPEPSNIRLVREFYTVICTANLLETQSVPFRNRRVNLSPARINRVLNIPEEENCPYGWTEEVQQLHQRELIAAISEDGEQYSHINLTNLSADAAFWNLFMSYNITPIGRRQGFTPMRYKVLYSLVRGEPLNLGKVIFNCICEASKLRRQRSLVFPVLITKLCRLSGINVQGAPNDMGERKMLSFQAVNNQRGRRNEEHIRSEAREAREARSGRNSSTFETGESSAQGATSSRQRNRRPAAEDFYQSLLERSMQNSFRLTELVHSSSDAAQAEVARLRAENEALRAELEAHQRHCSRQYTRRDTQ